MPRKLAKKGASQKVNTKLWDSNDISRSHRTCTLNRSTKHAVIELRQLEMAWSKFARLNVSMLNCDSEYKNSKRPVRYKG